MLSILVLSALPYLAQAQCQESEEGSLAIAEALIEQRQSVLIDAELEAIRAASRGESTSVFFIDIFGGFMPIPNRFVPFARTPGSFNSRNIFGAQFDDLFSLHGNIGVGRIDDESQPPEHPSEDFEVCRESTLSMYGLTVVIWDFDGYSQVHIFDDAEFIRITDFNKELWRAMINAWADLRRD